MAKEFLQMLFGLEPDYFFKLGDYSAYRVKNFIYIMVPVHREEQREIEERYELTRFLRERGELYVPSFVPSQKGMYVNRWEHRYYILLRLERWQEIPVLYPATNLAGFHQRSMGDFTKIRALQRFGKWQDLWEQRLQQLERVWQSIVMNGPGNEFETLFADSFPYYAGLGENAIQYFRDTLIDAPVDGMDAPVVCHEHFTEKTWGGPIVWKNPFDWVVDHPSRDLAEFSRSLYFRGTKVYMKPLRQFFSEYQSVYPLSSFGIRLMYSRLLLPLHYFQCVETYYSNPQDRSNVQLSVQLKNYMDRSDEYEAFLREFFDLLEVPHRKMQIPKPDWLSL